MAIKKIEIQDDKGNIYHPHTSSSVVFLKNGTSLDSYLEKEIGVGKKTLEDNINAIREVL